MLLYANDKSAWNAVDVLVNDGQLQHGHVINVVEGGLMINFQCPAQRSQFIEYGRIFRCSQYKLFWSSGEDEQVLLRRGPDGAWIWYPGRILPLAVEHYDDAVWVEVQLADGTVNELVLPGQVRPLPTDAELCQHLVMKEDFVVRSCPLPPAFWSEGSQRLREVLQCDLNQRRNIFCTALLSQALLYLQCRAAVPLTVEQVEAAYHEARIDVESGCLSWAAQRTLRQNRKGIDQKNWKRPVGGIHLPLPVELLVEVFQSLDSVGRVRCRRVCQLWNTVLTTDAYFPDVHVSGRYYEEHTDEMYWLLACLLKFPNHATKIIILKEVGWNDILGDLQTLINKLGKSPNVPTLVCYQCDIADDGDYMEEVVMRMTDMVMDLAVYQRIRWKQCRVHGYHIQAVVTEQFLYGKLVREELEEKMWDLFERNLLLKKPLDRPALSASFADYIAHKHTADIDERIVEGSGFVVFC
ncbi:uncharacterized protein LOC129599068 [Paramacrobiotus metropolitanus]|uniref:uncharacterized protein LOC129599068 n=1 Tax=Paramacrobiotus metropolitanus TaxID=2943436 RepID=UPI0024462EAA|nr:uncharacterized protein LOC129599068 [Paramacrobiotus metropolitanus]